MKHSAAIKFITINLLLIFGLSASQSQKVIYGYDDRVEVYQADFQFSELAKSTVALIRPNKLDENVGIFSLSSSVETLGERRNLCSSEPFKDQPTGAFCSGFLVGENLIVTAGHCIEDSYDCSNTRFVFDYRVDIDQVARRHFPVSDVYQCARIIAREKESAGPDWALIELDRPVEGREPLKVRQSGQLSIGEGLTVIGHPSGLPSKVAKGASVRSIESNGYLVANLDTYGGNSGSAVFNTLTGEVEGILVRGETDYASSGGCYISKRCEEDECRGEDVTLISQVCQVNGSDCTSDGSTPVPTPTPTPSPNGPNSCQYANDNSCDDGRPGAAYSLCSPGTDENDCSQLDFSNSCQYANDNSCDDGRPGAAYSLCTAGTDENDCSQLDYFNSCQYANDNSCDDGRPGAAYSLCAPGTDENDCGGL